jgi:hypothetical protein
MDFNIYRVFRILRTFRSPRAVRRLLWEGQMDIWDKSGVALGMQSESAMTSAIDTWTSDAGTTGNAVI